MRLFFRIIGTCVLISVIVAIICLILISDRLNKEKNRKSDEEDKN